MSRNIAPLESGTETDTATETGDETLSETHEMQAMIHLPGKKNAEVSGTPEARSLLHHKEATTPRTPRVPTTGGQLHSTTGGNISLPEGGGGFPAQVDIQGSHAAIVSMPGLDEPQAIPAVNAPPRYPVKPLEMAVYFMDKQGLKLLVEDGQNATAGEIFELIMDESGYPAEARDVFSLWLVSDLLELQLKPNHVPFKLVCFWDELLERYTNAEEDDIERDEPVLMFQRNVFCPRAKDKLIKDGNLLKLLYHEAKKNVLDGRYPMEERLYHMLAGYQALLEARTYNPNTHTQEYYKSRVQEFYPECMVKNTKKFFSLFSKNTRLEQLVTSHMAAHRKMGNMEHAQNICSVYSAYLEICWKFPFYGAAYFNGQIEHRNSGLSMRSSSDDPIYLAINTDGVFVLDMDDVDFLLGLLYSELSWQFAEPSDRSNKNCLPCLFLQFPDKSQRNKASHMYKVLQIFSREAVLMDAMIESCIKLKAAGQAETTRGLDSTDGDDDGILKSDGETWKKFEKLCLTTFNKKGECVGTNAKLPKKT